MMYHEDRDPGDEQPGQDAPIAPVVASNESSIWPVGIDPKEVLTRPWNRDPSVWNNSTQFEVGPFDKDAPDGWVLPSQHATEVVELPNAIAEWHPASGAAGEHTGNLEGESD
jgi:hypothetical protein